MCESFDRFTLTAVEKPNSITLNWRKDSIPPIVQEKPKYFLMEDLPQNLKPGIVVRSLREFSRTANAYRPASVERASTSTI